MATTEQTYTDLTSNIRTSHDDHEAQGQGALQFSLSRKHFRRGRTGGWAVSQASALRCSISDQQAARPSPLPSWRSFAQKRGHKTEAHSGSRTTSPRLIIIPQALAEGLLAALGIQLVPVLRGHSPGSKRLVNEPRAIQEVRAQRQEAIAREGP